MDVLAVCLTLIRHYIYTKCMYGAKCYTYSMQTASCCPGLCSKGPIVH